MQNEISHTARSSALAFVHPAAEDTPVLRIAPLVDIVLLLICFYLVVSRSIQTHDDPQVQLPHMAKQRTMTTQPAEMVINLRQDGSVIVNARVVDMPALADLLRREQQRATANEQNLDVVIRADQRQRYHRLDDLLDACRRAGLGQVVFRSTEERSP